ncbi:MAG: CoA transferase subunit A [Desulfobacterales bacterium]|nr:CoA transferase subunit A [Desulfobacterales bacterium]
MPETKDKTMTLAEAVARFVADGSHLSMGGFTINRNPMAAVREIIRQGRQNLHLYAHSNGQGLDELVGAGCVARAEIAYAGNGRFAPTCIRFRKAVEAGTLAVEDYSNFQMVMRFTAGAMGVPFLPTRSGPGTDIVNHWGFSQALRKDDPALPDAKLKVVDNPFGTWHGTEKLVLVPAASPDVTLIHVQQADADGTVRISGLPFADVEQAKAARAVIVTCEDLVPAGALNDAPDRNHLPGFCVDAVVHVPFGAWPTACYGRYDYDPAYFRQYAERARDDERFRRHLAEFVFDAEGDERVTDLVGKDRLDAIAADPRTGYATKLDRR